MRGKGWNRYTFFGESYKFYKENQKLFLEFFIKGSENTKLLDLGCSDGKFTKEIAKSIGTDKIYGIEMNKASAKKSKGMGIIVKSSDLNKKFPFPDESFDVVSGNQVLEHLWNTDNFFREVNRVLKNGGYAIISTPNLSSFHSIFFILLGNRLQ